MQTGGSGGPAPSVREEKDWQVLYGSRINLSRPFRSASEVNEEAHAQQYQEVKSSPVKKATSPPKRRSVHMSTQVIKPPLGVRPGNDWKARLQAVRRQGQVVGKTVSTAQGSMLILPMKRGRGRPPKNAAAMAPQKILVIPPLLKTASTTKGSAMDLGTVSEEQFALERPLHYLHYEPPADCKRAKVFFSSFLTLYLEYDLQEEESGWVSTGTGEDARIGVMGGVEYDMDEQDFAWLKLLNAERNAAGLEPVTEDDFEYLIDRLEKHWFHLVLP